MRKIAGLLELTTLVKLLNEYGDSVSCSEDVRLLSIAVGTRISDLRNICHWK